MRIPTSTYRLQIQPAFQFEAAQTIIDYLAELGISDIYSSPIFTAREGSTHGYDVVDPTHLNPELGTIDDFNTLSQTVHKHQLGWIQDIVPNHMAYDSRNFWLMDVLANAEDSDYFDFFDINWNQQFEEMHGRVLTPMLGDFYSNCLEKGEIKLDYGENGLSVQYYALKLPIRIYSYTRFLTHNLGQLTRKLGRNHPDLIKLLGILYLIKTIPETTKGQERQDQISFVKAILWELYTENQQVKEFIDDNLTYFNGEVGNPESFNDLDSILDEQFYRLAFWKVGAEEINYRRFFTVNELISVKVEEKRVFDRTHSLIFKLVEEGKFTGLRIDHVDGLYHPTEYLQRLRESAPEAYILVEKILETEEKLPSHWPIQGTSGYDFLNYVNGLLCCRTYQDDYDRIYKQFSGLRDRYEDLVQEKKALILEKNLVGDLDNLAQILKQIASQTRGGSDFTLNGLTRALFEVLTLFPVYCTYVSADGVSNTDKHYIDEAIALAKKSVPLLVKELGFIHKLLLLEFEDFRTKTQREEWLHFVMRLQQLTGPLMAKGVEDTLLYVYNRLLSLNEVGGNPGEYGVDEADFHTYNQDKAENWPHAMNCTATHDTKRGEDMRARLNVLSEIPEQWQKQLYIWHEINQKHKTDGMPDRNDEYFLYQTLIGAYPFDHAELENFVDRIKNYIIKAIREAKVHTAWLQPDSEYEEAFLHFIDRILEPSDSNEFLGAFIPWQTGIATYGIYNSLSQVLLKYAAPGVPDLYQGTELWDLSLVDPDNRRPVDYPKRREFLSQIIQGIDRDILGLIDQLLQTKEDGKIKLFLTYQLLQARQRYPNLFQLGDYQPIRAAGDDHNRIIAFSRTNQDRTLVAIAPRFLTAVVHPNQLPIGEVWQDTSLKLPGSYWRNLITGETLSGKDLSVAEILQHFPVALLTD